MKTDTTKYRTNGQKTINDALIMLLRAGVIATFGLVLCVGMAAGAFPADWTHSDLITIEEHSGSDLADYQIQVELNASNFDFSKAQPDGADIRFAELDDTLLNYWTESWNPTAESAKIWVKVPSIPASGTTMIRMWYGDAGAVDASDGDAVFILFDDFEDGTVGSSPSGWLCSGNCNNKISSDLAYSGTQSVKMTGVSGSCWESLMHRYIGEPSPYRIAFSVYPPSYSASGCHDSKGYLWLHTCASWTCSGRGFINFGRSSNHITACGSTMDYITDRWHEVEVVYVPTASDVFTKSYINNDFFTECTSSRAGYEDSLRYLSFGSGDGYNYYDLIYVSKYVSSEPTVTFDLTSIPATVDIDPDTLNLKSNGEWITAYIELPDDCDVNNIDISTVVLTTPSGDTVQVDPIAPTTVEDYDVDDIYDLMVKFDRATVVACMGETDAIDDGTGIDCEIELTIAGELTDGTQFEGTDTIRVIKKGK